MPDELELFPHSANDDTNVDAESALIMAYLARELSPAQVAAVEERLENDSAFRDNVWPIMEGWFHPRLFSAPVADVASSVVSKNGILQRSFVRVAAVIALAVVPVVGVAQLAVYSAKALLKQADAPAPDYSANAAQAIPQMPLKPANATLRAEFTRIMGVRELADGRVLVTDPKEKRLVVADFSSNSVTQIGRTGEGPGEYHTPGMLWATGGDSTIMSDAMGHPDRIVLAGARIALTLPRDNPTSRGNLHGADRNGRMLANILPERNRDGSLPKEYLLIRYDPGTGRIDSVSGMSMPSSVAGAAPGGPGSTSGSTGNARYMIGVEVTDDALMFPDGWVAIVHSYPYRVRWCSPDLKCNDGPELRPGNIPLLDKHKRVWIDYLHQTSTWPPTNDVARTGGWPAFLPPTGGPFYAAPDGRLFVEKFPASEGPPLRYDIIDRSGKINAQLLLPMTEKIVGFGTRSVYLAAIDSVGIQRLRRHPWP